MNRAERRRQLRQQEKSRLPLNSNVSVAEIAGMTGQDVAILQTYLKLKENEITEIATDACIREAQEKTGKSGRLHNNCQYHNFSLCNKNDMGIYKVEQTFLEKL